MGETSIPKPVLFGILGVVLIAAAFYFVTQNKSSDDSGSTTTTTVPATSPPAKTTTTENTASKKSSSKSTAKQDKAAIQKAATAYGTAYADGDGAAACAAMTPTAQAEAKELGALAGKSSCEEAIAASAAKLPASAKAELQSAKFEDITIDGDVATATFGAQTVYFQKQAGGEWLYQGTTAPGGTSNKGGAKDPSTTAAKPSTGTTDAAAQTTKVDPTSLPKNVQKALDANKIVTILFWRPQGVEDRDMQKVTGLLHKAITKKDSKRFAVFEPGVKAITRWIKITGVEGVSMTPSYIVIGKGGKADVQTGFIDAGTMVNAIVNDYRAFSAGRNALAKVPTN